MKWGSNFKLGKATSETLGNRLYERLKTEILIGHLANGTRVPSTREMAAQLSISRNTVTFAYDQLIAEGFLMSKRGSGTFVAQNLPDTKPTKTIRAIRKPSASIEDSKSNPNFREIATQSAASLGYKAPLPLQSGIPDLESFPIETWIKLHNRYLRKSPYSLSNYGHGPGYKPLREAIAAHLNTYRGTDCDAEQVLILSGSQQGIDITLNVLLNTGDKALIENPCYDGVPECLRFHKLEPVPIEVDQHGLNVEEAIRRCSDAKLCITTPSHQFPLGETLSASRRLQLINWASESGSWILEDDYDSEFRFKGNPISAMQGLDPNRRTLYLGTFSKVLFPDIRIGYLILPHELVDRFEHARNLTSGNPPIALQATLAAFMTEGHFHKHIRRMRKRYAQRKEIVLSLLDTHCSEYLSPGNADAGMHLVALLKKDWSDTEIAQMAKQVNLRISPLSGYSIKPPKRRGFIIGYSSYDEQQIEAAIQQLGHCLRQYAKRPIAREA